MAAGTTYAGQYLKLTSDIALTGEWTPIGSSGTLAFGGTFDGDGHCISGMTITDSTLGYVGLFGYTLNGVVIQNVHLTDVSINISDAAQNVYAGALVAFIKNNTSGTASSIIDGCTVSGSISITTANGPARGHHQLRHGRDRHCGFRHRPCHGRRPVCLGEHPGALHEQLCAW